MLDTVTTKKTTTATMADAVKAAYRVIREAAEVKAEYLAALAHRRERPRPSLAACLASIPLAGTPKDREQLRGTLPSLQSAEALRRAIIAAFCARPGSGQQTDIDRPCPRSGLASLFYPSSPALVERAEDELHDNGATLGTLMAVAFEDVHREHPEQFGTATFEEIDARRDEPEREYHAALERVEALPTVLKRGWADELGIDNGPRDLAERLIDAVAARG